MNARVLVVEEVRAGPRQHRRGERLAPCEQRHEGERALPLGLRGELELRIGGYDRIRALEVQRPAADERIPHRCLRLGVRVEPGLGHTLAPTRPARLGGDGPVVVDEPDRRRAGPDCVGRTGEEHLDDLARRERTRQALGDRLQPLDLERCELGSEPRRALVLRAGERARAAETPAARSSPRSGDPRPSAACSRRRARTALRSRSRRRRAARSR